MKTDHRKPVLLLAAAVLASLALSGCMTRGKFACSAPDGVSCMSTQQIYELTNGSSLPAQVDSPQRRSRAKSGKVVSHQVGATGDALALSAPTQNPNGAFSTTALALGSPNTSNTIQPGGSESVARIPARVMRIWISPWTDDAGDLHMPGYVFSEVSTRRWSIGGDVRAETPSSFDPNGPWQPTSPRSNNN